MERLRRVGNPQNCDYSGTEAKDIYRIKTQSQLEMDARICMFRGLSPYGEPVVCLLNVKPLS
jgi:hypothetical protein